MAALDGAASLIRQREMTPSDQTVGDETGAAPVREPDGRCAAQRGPGAWLSRRGLGCSWRLACRRPALVVVLLAASALFVVQVAGPGVARFERLGTDAGFRLRYAVNTGLAGGARQGGKAVAGDICLIGIDSPSLARLGRFGGGDWVVRDPFRRLVSVLRNVFTPSVVAFDILFRPTVATHGPTADSAIAPEAIAHLRQALDPLLDGRSVTLERGVLLDMTRLAAEQGDASFAAALLDLGAPLDPRRTPPVPVINAYDFSGLEVPTILTWSATDVAGPDDDDGTVDGGETIPYLLDVAIPDAQIRRVPSDYHYVRHATLPTNILRDCAQHGFINVPRDVDGIIRRVPLVLGFEFAHPRTHAVRRAFVPSFALLAVLRHWGLDQKALEVHFGRHVRIRRPDAPDVVVPIDNAGNLFLNFKGRIRDFHNVSLASLLASGEAVLADLVDSEDTGRADERRAVLERIRHTVAGRLAMVGLTATGATDSGPCPVDPQTPYVHIHMTAAENILTGRFIAPLGPLGRALVLGLVALGYTALSVRLRVVHLSWATAGFAVGYLALCYGLLHADVALMPVVQPMLWVGLTYPGVMVFRYCGEERGRKMVRRMFSTMVSPEVLTFMEENPESFSLSGQRAEATVMFSDVSGFTSIAERLAPEALSELLNTYFTAMTDIIMRSGGYVDKYQGDAIMADWGIPYPDPRHAEAACLAALEQQEALARIRPELERRFGSIVDVRMGLCSGPVSAGNMGSAQRFQYTVMGDTVNQAARFEPANKSYGTRIIVGDTTVRLAGEAMETRLLDRILVTGKQVPVAIHELLGRRGTLDEPTKALVAAYESALRWHWERRWPEAVRQLEQALSIRPQDTPSRVLLARIRDYMRAEPEAAWQGEYRQIAKH